MESGLSIDLGPSIAERSYDRIRADIVFGRLAPGRRLRLDMLARAYGASVSTLREILSRLSSDGFVVAEGQRGFEVAEASAAHFRDVASLRLLLERHAIARSFAAGDLDWEAGVVAAHYKLATLERRMLAGDRSETELWKRYDREFHQALIAACGSQVLLDAYEGVFDHYLRYQMVAVVFRGAVAADEHRALLDAALARDTDRAAAVLQAHIMGCVADTLARGMLK